MNRASLSFAATIILGASVIPWAASAQVGAAARVGAGVGDAVQAHEGGQLTLVQRRGRSFRGGRSFSRRSFSGRSFSRRSFSGRSFRRFSGRSFRPTFRSRRFARIAPGIALGFGVPYYYSYYNDWCWDERLVPTRYGWRWREVWVC